MIRFVFPLWHIYIQQICALMIKDLCIHIQGWHYCIACYVGDPGIVLFTGIDARNRAIIFNTHQNDPSVGIGEGYHFPGHHFGISSGAFEFDSGVFALREYVGDGDQGDYFIVDVLLAIAGFKNFPVIL